MDFAPRRLEEREESTKIVFDTLSKDIVDIAFKIQQSMGSAANLGFIINFGEPFLKRRLNASCCSL